jgi:SnoaL-like domain
VRFVRDGRFTQIELREPDRAALLGRYGERAGHPALVRPEPWMAGHAARDWEALRGLYAPGYTLLDRRTMGWALWHGAQAALDNHRAVLEVLPDVRADFAPLRWDGETLAYLGTFTGHDPSGGEVEARMAILTVTRNGRALIDEVLDPDDEAAIAARFEVLRAPAARAVLDWAERHNAAGPPEWVEPDVVAADDRTARAILTTGERRTAVEFTLAADGSLTRQEVPGADRGALLAQ